MRYARILASLWTSSKKWKQTDDDARLLYFYLQTGPHRNSVGCYPLPLGYVVEDTGWDLEKVKATMAKLSTSELIELDPEESVVFLIQSILKDPPANPSHAFSMLKTLGDLPDCPPRTAAIEELFLTRHGKAIPDDQIDTL